VKTQSDNNANYDDVNGGDDNNVVSAETTRSPAVTLTSKILQSAFAKPAKLRPESRYCVVSAADADATQKELQAAAEMYGPAPTRINDSSCGVAKDPLLFCFASASPECTPIGMV
jgi:hypothetical protein